MKLLVLYRPRSEHARIVDEFAHDFERTHHGKKMEMISLDTRDGSAIASLYDVTTYPAIMALQDDGQLLQMWQGSTLPVMNEVAAYS